MNKLDIMQLETKTIVKNPDWFYHAFEYGNIAKIVQNGLLAKKYLEYKNPNFGLNGKYYISVSKDIVKSNDTNLVDSAFNNYKRNFPLLILDNIKAYKCQKNSLSRLFTYTSIPLRYSYYDDEYQVYSQIKPENFVGIECMLYDWAINDQRFILKRFHNMLVVLKSLDIELPIYDFSRLENDVAHEIDTDSYLSLYKKIQ